MDIKTLTSGALIKHPSRGLLLGTGPFRESAEPPDSGPAFYIDTFRLDDPRPWKIPAALHALPAEGNPPPPAPEIRWAEPSPDAYAQVFAEMMEQIAAGQLMKSVPAIPQFGEMLLPHTPGTHPAGHQQLSVPLSLRLVDGTGRILRNHSGNTVPPAGPPPGDNGPGRNGPSGG